MIIKKNISNWMVIGIWILLLALVWAAADDITTGNQPDYRWEYLTLVVGAGMAGFGLGRLVKKK